MRRPLQLLALALLPRLLIAQGVTTAALQGRVVSEDGVPVAGATIRVTNTLNGRRWEVATRSTGGCLLENVEVGGPYLIEVRALGFAPESRAGIVLTLGARWVADFTLHPAAIELAPVALAATADPPRGHGGPVQRARPHQPAVGAIPCHRPEPADTARASPRRL